jgi:hypothetical protein
MVENNEKYRNRTETLNVVTVGAFAKRLMPIGSARLVPVP